MPVVPAFEADLSATFWTGQFGSLIVICFHICITACLGAPSNQWVFIKSLLTFEALVLLIEIRQIATHQDLFNLLLWNLMPTSRRTLELIHLSACDMALEFFNDAFSTESVLVVTAKLNRTLITAWNRLVRWYQCIGVADRAELFLLLCIYVLLLILNVLLLNFSASLLYLLLDGIEKIFSHRSLILSSVLCGQQRIIIQLSFSYNL